MAKSILGYKHQSITRIRAALSSSYATIATGAADDSDVYALEIINTGASTRTLTVALQNDGSNDDVIAVISIAASAGIAAGNNAIRLISGNYLPYLIYDNAGNLHFRLYNGNIIKMKQDSGTDLIVKGYQLNF